MFLGKVNIFRSSLSRLRKKVIGEYREDVLSNIICKNLEKYINKNKNKDKNFNFLDYGAGYNPILIKKIIKKLSSKYKKKNFTAYCYDFYDKKKINELNTNKKIVFKHIHKLRLSKIKSYNFCLVVDVIHHINIDNKKKIIDLLKFLKKKSKLIIIKDHLQYGFISNLILIFMDLLGNYGDGTRIPTKYFNEHIFNNFVSQAKLKKIKMIKGISLYKPYWLILSNPKYQFISILK
tara:strand:- start:1166 stop:1870 length:705 start_codon:yes stop_codon:yes gene_type:complete